MAAGLSRKQINSRVRNRLQSIAREHGGRYVPGSKLAKPHVAGETADQLLWTARFSVSSMSNGETVGYPIFTVEAFDRPDLAPRSTAGLFGANLPQALDSFRAHRDGLVRYCVLRQGAPGEVLNLKPSEVTPDLGLARYGQLQCGNSPNLWELRDLGAGRFQIVREVPYSGAESLDALKAYQEARGLDSFSASKLPPVIEGQGRPAAEVRVP